MQGAANYVSRAPVAATISFSGAATLDSACTEAIEYRHPSSYMAREAEWSSMTKLRKKVLPGPLRRPMHGAALFVVPSLRRRLTRTRRRRNRLKRHVRGTRNRLRRKLQRFLRNVWRRQLKQRIWPAIWRIDTWRRGNQPLESNNQIHLISSLWGRIELGNAQRTLHLFDELKDHADVHLWTERPSVPPEIRKRYPVKRIVPERFEFPKTGTFVFVGSSTPSGRGTATLIRGVSF